MVCSMSRKGTLGNAPTESLFNSFKNERVHGLSYETRAEITAMSLEYIEVLYKRKRQHSTLGYKPPMQFLEGWL
jgi:putative transposase